MLYLLAHSLGEASKGQDLQRLYALREAFGEFPQTGEPLASLVADARSNLCGVLLACRAPRGVSGAGFYKYRR